MTGPPPAFVGATPVWWQSQTEVSVCIDLGADADAAVETLASVAASEGPLPEVLMLVESAASPAADAVLEWLLTHLWLPALVLEGEGGPKTLLDRARSGCTHLMRAGETVHHRALFELCDAARERGA